MKNLEMINDFVIINDACKKQCYLQCKLNEAYGNANFGVKPKRLTYDLKMSIHSLKEIDECQEGKKFQKDIKGRKFNNVLRNLKEVRRMLFGDQVIGKIFGRS